MARRTVLVCDNCGKEVGENKGAAMRITFTDARRGSKVADLCDTLRRELPGPRRRPPRTPPEVRNRLTAHAAIRREIMHRATSAPGRRGSPSGRRIYDGSRPGGTRLALNLVVGPANAGKVALLLERYLARLEDEPFLIVPNRADVARCRARPARRSRVPARRLDRDVRRPVRADRRRRTRAAGPSRRGRSAPCVARRAVARRAAGRSLAACVGALPGVHRRAARRALGRSRAGCSTRPTSTASSARSSRAYRDELDRARALGPRPAPAQRVRAAPLRPRLPGTASPSSPTASRI